MIDSFVNRHTIRFLIRTFPTAIPMRTHRGKIEIMNQHYMWWHNHYTTPFFEYKIRNLARGLFSLWPKQQYVNLSQRGDSKTQQMQQQRNQMEHDGA